jgi:hypothetical protein
MLKVILSQIWQNIKRDVLYATRATPVVAYAPDLYVVTLGIR